MRFVLNDTHINSYHKTKLGHVKSKSKNSQIKRSRDSPYLSGCLCLVLCQFRSPLSSRDWVSVQGRGAMKVPCIEALHKAVRLTFKLIKPISPLGIGFKKSNNNDEIQEGGGDCANTRHTSIRVSQL